MLYYEGTADAVSFKFYLRKEKIFMKINENLKLKVNRLGLKAKKYSQIGRAHV